jgi:transmembrane sensor
VFVVAAALAVSALVFLGPRIGRDDVGKALASPEALRVESKPGQRGRLGLSDGTQAVLGANSKLIIPSGFASRLRALKLEGTASFTVAPHPKLSFLVRTDRATITALGTVFDVSAFPGDRLLTVRVRQGEVELKTPKGTRHVQQGEAVSVEPSGLIFLASAVELAETLGWVDGQLVINDRPLRDALPVLHRWFDLDIRLAEEQLSDRRVTMRVGLDSTLTAIRLLQENAHVALTYDRNRPVLYDAGAARRR